MFYNRAVIFLTFVVIQLCSNILLAKESILYCPNEQKPKLNPDGSLFQCLPGQKWMCGEGYACYFSGFNYQCCPSEEEHDYATQPLECPESALTVIGNDGAPISCNLKSQPCPETWMSCTEAGTTMICCQQPSFYEHQKTIAKEDHPQQNEHSEAVDLDCPPGSFALVDYDGNPMQCRDSACHRNDRFCQNESGESICCERHQMKTTAKQKDLSSRISTSNNFNKVNTYLDGIVKLHQPELNSFKSAPSEKPSKIIQSQTLADQTQSVTPHFDRSTQTIPTDPPNFEDKHEKARGVRLESRSKSMFPTEAVKFRPHSAGGYAFSVMSHEDAREYARNYLLKQIRNGWPYDDRYYSSSVMNEDGIPLPDAHLAFHNK